MSTGIWLVRAEALPLGRLLAARFGATLYEPWRTADPAPRAQFAATFGQHRHWILVMASGIAVRYLDGLPAHKRQDPAVVVVDEAARFAVSLLSGHEGGANALAHDVARLTGAIPVITTATEALKPLTIGLGCRRGTPREAIGRAIASALGERPLSHVRQIATLDLKADEAGLLAWCEDTGIPLRVIATADVAARGWTRQPSDWVRQNAGVDGVCEPCALIASPRGRLVLPKTILDGVTIALVDDTPTLLQQECPTP